MAERHRGPRPGGRDGFEGREGREGRGREGGPRDFRGGREGRDDRPRRPFGGGFGGGGYGGGGGGFGGPPPYRERRPAPPPPPPPADDEFQEVDAGLAVAILETAAHLTEVVGTAGLPEGYAERREAVLETFESIYYRVLETVTGGEEAEEEDAATEDEDE